MKQTRLFSGIMMAALLSSGVALAQGFSPLKKTYKGNSEYFKMPATATEGTYVPKTVILKVKPQYRAYCEAKGIEHLALKQYLDYAGMKTVGKMFPRHEPPSIRSINGHPTTDLSLIYEVEYTADIPLEQAINSMLSTGLFEYAEPHYIPKPFYTPNDYKNSTHYARMKLVEAWDTEKGDPNVVIGIVDTEINTNHPDLQGNLWTNPNEIAGNGIDDDNNGFIDDVNGWDLGEDDASTIDNTSANLHGSHVAGLAAATPDNGTGLAGTGFNCSYLPIKAADENGELRFTYGGLVYAADQGCRVVNASWGGPNGGSFVQDIVNYVTVDKNCLIIASSGNDGAGDDMYPASLDKVISCGATLSNDRKASFSNFGPNVDIHAAGSNIYSCWGSSYTSTSGTSMSSPVAAGVAGLVASAFPNYTALQVGAQLKATCDNIDGVTGNAAYAGKLGAGRLNAQEAVTNTSVKAAGITIPPKDMYDNNDDALSEGDTIRMVLDFTNYLAAASNMTATLTSSSSAVTVMDGSTTLGAMTTNETKDNTADPFTINIKSGIALNTDVEFEVTLSDGSYSEDFRFSIIVNVDYLNIEVNEIATTVTSRGLVGYNLPNQEQGKGLSYKQLATLYEAGLMIGNAQGRVSDVVREMGGSPADDDFYTIDRIKEISSSIADFEAEAKFDDRDNPDPSPLGIEVDHKAYAWNEPGHTKYVIVEYTINNKSGAQLDDMYAGIFSDWDVYDQDTYFKNRCNTDHTNRVGYVYYTGPSGLYAGIKLLSYTAPFNHYAMNLAANISGNISANYEYTDTTKYITMSTPKDTAGPTGDGADVAAVISTGPFSIPDGEAKTVAFALIVGDNLTDLQTSSINSQAKYELINGIENEVPQKVGILSQNYPNPAMGNTSIEYNISENDQVVIEMYNQNGQLIEVLENGNKPAGWHKINVDVSNYASGNYYYQMKFSGQTFTRKMSVINE